MHFSELIHQSVTNMFNLPPDLWWVEKIIRPIFVYMFLIIGLRVAGKRELAQLNPFDLVVLLTLSNTLQNAIIGNDNSVTGGFIGAAALLGINYSVVRLMYRNKRLQRLVEGRSDILVRHGELQMHNLKHELITPAELMSACHREGISSLHDVELATLEPTGTISFIQKKPTLESQRHREVVEMLKSVMQEVAALKAARPSPAAEG